MYSCADSQLRRLWLPLTTDHTRLSRGVAESLDWVKPAHLECEPTTGTNIQRTTQNKQQSLKTTRISSRNPQGPPRLGSADTQTSNRTSVKKTKSTAVRSSSKLATVPQQLDDKVKLSNKDNTYIAPHSQAPAVSRANGNGGGLRTYSLIPLHLRGKTPGAADAVIDSNKINRSNILHSWQNFDERNSEKN